jgi:hypothetical protein
MMMNDSLPPIVLLPPGEYDGDEMAYSEYDLTPSSSRLRFRNFFRNFRLSTLYIYREELLRRWNLGEYFVEVDLAHLNEFDEVLFNALQVMSFTYAN